MKSHRDDVPAPEESATDSLDSLTLAVEANEDLAFKPRTASHSPATPRVAPGDPTGPAGGERCVSVEASECGPFLPRRKKPEDGKPAG
jgi:hypothetical protein